MALSGTNSLLATALALAAGSADAPGILAWGNLADAFISWAPAKITAVSTGTIPLVAAGAVVSGKGTIAVADAAGLGQAFADAIPLSVADAVGRSAWNAIASALASWIASKGSIDPSSFVASPGGGAVTGTGLYAITNLAVGPSLATAAGSTDAPGQAAWQAIGQAFLNHLKNHVTIIPGAFASPPGGGPVVGIGVIT